MNPRVLHGNLSQESDFFQAQMILHLDTGRNSPRTLALLKSSFQNGQTIVNFLSNDVSSAMGLKIGARNLTPRPQGANFLSAQPLDFYLGKDGELKSQMETGARKVQMMSSSPVYAYDLGAQNKHCVGILFSHNETVGYRCQIGTGTFIQVGALIFEDYNSDKYGSMPSVLERRTFLKALAQSAGVQSRLELSANAAQTVAFARQDPKTRLLWITVKTGSTVAQKLRLTIHSSLLLAKTYRLVEPLAEKTKLLGHDELVKNGFPLTLSPNGSVVFVLEPQKTKAGDN
jgi:hypothetical protein